jgi:hypothetical protein
VNLQQHVLDKPPAIPKNHEEWAEEPILHRRRRNHDGGGENPRRRSGGIGLECGEWCAAGAKGSAGAQARA